jgi:type IV fimbrial biogenesis protein FimT
MPDARLHPTRSIPCGPPPLNAREALPVRARSRGLTLIESMIVVVLIALGCTLALPSLAGLFDRQRLRGVASEIAGDLQWTRSQALARGEALRFSIHSNSAGSCTIVHTGQRDHCSCSDDGRASCTGDAQLFKTSRWPIGESVSVQANVGSMLFDPLLGTASPAGSVRIVDARGHGITHVVNIIGRVRSCSPSGAVSGLAAC